MQSPLGRGKRIKHREPSASSPSAPFRHVLLSTHDEDTVAQERRKEMAEKDVNESPFMHGCRDFANYHHDDVKYIFAMMIGASPQKDLGLGVAHFDAERPPFGKHRRTFKPTLRVLQDELIRRATRAKASRIPRPTQWSSDKILSALTTKFPPKFTEDDKAFLQQQCTKVFAGNHEEPESATGPAVLEREAGWDNTNSHLRLFHVLAELRGKFLVKQRDPERDGISRHPLFWQEATKRFNEDTWVPASIEINSVEGYDEPKGLPFMFPQKVLDTELTSTFIAIKERLVPIIKAYHQKHGLPVVSDEDGHPESWEFKAADLKKKVLGGEESPDGADGTEEGKANEDDTDRNEDKEEKNDNAEDDKNKDDGGENVKEATVEDLQNYELYLWEFANQMKLLGSVLADVSDKLQSEEPERKPPPKPKKKKVAKIKPKRISMKRVLSAYQRRRRHHTGASIIDPDDDDGKFLECQDLFVRQVRLYNEM